MDSFFNGSCVVKSTGCCNRAQSLLLAAILFGWPSLAPAGDYILGADVSSLAEQVDQGIVFVDTDGEQKDLLSLLKNHGFNYIRLRTFVEPLNDYSYASDDSCPGKAEAYNDRDHIVEMARQIKAAGMGLLLDFHYSDTWADPSKQVIPEAWRGAETVDELATYLRDYTTDVMRALASAGVVSDMVQVGNEITPGLLIHVPTAETDCYGNGSVPHTGPNGSAADWESLATLVRTGIEAVTAVQPNARIMLHIENTSDYDGIVAWVENALDHGLEFDILGLSAYERWQGPAGQWRQTFTDLAATFPDLDFSIVEYGDAKQLVNDIMRGLPANQGIGAFIWEPALSGPWGKSMFEREGKVMTAKSEAFAVYDRIARSEETCSATMHRSKKKTKSRLASSGVLEDAFHAVCLADAIAKKCPRQSSLVCHSTTGRMP
jgi:arabinogalactan endo-1,4-beta-galactosidase